MFKALTGLIALLTCISAALAQAPVEGAPANTPNNTSTIGSYWWLIVVVVLAALALWYFAQNRNRT